MLGVLALAFLLRCMLDPWDLVYYHLPLVVALAAWEARRGRDLPVLVGRRHRGLLADVRDSTTRARGYGPYVAYLAWTVPLAVGLGVALLRPARAGAPRPGAAAAGPVPA